MYPKRTKKMNPPTISSSKASSTSTVPSASKQQEESDEEETSQTTEIIAQAERIASLELLVSELLQSQASNAKQTSSSSNVLSESNRMHSESLQPQINQLIDNRAVPKKNYLVTSPSVSKQLLANRIHADTKDSFMKISMIRGSLTTAGLKYLLDGHRKKPVPSATNKFGYRERCIQTIQTIDETTGLPISTEIMIDEDDCFLYDYDCGRLYSAIIEKLYITS